MEATETQVIIHDFNNLNEMGLAQTQDYFLVTLHLYKSKARIVGGVYPLFLTVVFLEYIAEEVIELAGIEARDNEKKRIVPRHIQLAMRERSGVE